MCAQISRRFSLNFEFFSETKQAVRAKNVSSLDQKGRKGAGVKGAGVANCRIFRSAVPSVVVWSILLVSLRKAFQPEFGAYRGSARVLNSPSNPQNCREKENILEKGTFKTCAKLWYAPNPGSKEI